MSPSLVSCSACAGLVPASRATCPHCEAPRRRIPGALARLAGAAGCLVTLMACYGAVPHPQDYATAGCQDGDGDQSCVPQDCNDADPAVYPGAQDPDLDQIDQNCDGVDGWRDPGAVAE